jgi:hypothetical protein
MDKFIGKLEISGANEAKMTYRFDTYKREEITNLVSNHIKSFVVNDNAIIIEIIIQKTVTP